ncbi:C40 family peptidase [Solwaraspora sp. WMMD1047]|uniref:C40 family peptidase n=1 Tax=Solwaraspora sp. WMMD1047 TaxID=3016102 RepID=UPI002417EB95|nr:C40 family peptidase [Solwaraspora sp. WMMD1047]MDG4827921.1 C40 family peptidase [Solwaraspora sp. WMMD1047]
MAQRRHHPKHRSGTISPRLRPVLWSAMLAAAGAVAFATPGYADPTLPNTVPDPGSRPVPSGSLQLPGATPPPATNPLPAPVNGPLAAQVTALQIEVATLADQLLGLEQQQNTTASALAAADQTLRQARQALAAAQQSADDAAGEALKDAAALPPGAFGSDLHGLGSLSRIERGERSGGDTTGPARELNRARAAEQAAYQAFVTAQAQADAADAQFAAAQGNFRKREDALEKLRRDNRDKLIEIERLQEEAEGRLGATIGIDGIDGMAAHPRALAAVSYALAQRGDPYLWAAEGPDRFDCSGLMWAAYRSKGADYRQLPRVAKDQYYATRGRSVDRSALLPGDLIFFASGSHWTTIHHVGMYVGNGQMVHAPRSGDVVKVSNVTWSRFYRATRIFGAIPAPDTPPPTNPGPTNPGPTNPGPTTPPPTTPPPTTSPPTTPPPTTPPPTTPPTTPAPTDPPTTPAPTTPPATPATTPPRTPESSTEPTPSDGAESSSAPTPDATPETSPSGTSPSASAD